MEEEIKNLRLSVSFRTKRQATPVVMVATFLQKAQMASIGPLFEDANPASRPTSELEVTSEKNDELEDYGTMTPPPHAM